MKTTRFSGNKIIKLFIASGLVLLVFSYVLYQSRNFILGPRIFIKEPLDGQLFNSSFVKIKGQAVNTTNLRINDYPILVDETGKFEKDLLLAKGYNIISLSAEDRFGRTIHKKLRLVYRQNKHNEFNDQKSN
jgi:hypothetical protein